MKNILIIRLSSLGDILLTTPVIRSLKKHLPDCNIDYLTKIENKEALEFNPHLRKVYIFREETSLDDLTAGGYDLVIDLQNNIKSIKLTSGVERKIRFNKSNVKKFLLVNFKLNLLENFPQIPERYALSIKRSGYLPGFELDNEGLEMKFPVQEVPLDPRHDYIAIAPGSKHFTKRWPEYHFTVLCRMILDSGAIPVLIGGTSDIKICAAIQESEPGVINLCSENELFKISSILAQCKAAVTCDSGLMHLSCAVKTPVLVIFGSTVQEFGFTPYKNKSIVIENDSLSCRPCSHIGKSYCPQKHFKCLTDIQPADVFESLSRLVYED